MVLLYLLMLFSEIPGHELIKKHLTDTASSGRIPHAQLFVGPEGSATLPVAIAYAQYVLCSNSGGENQGGSEACNLKMSHLNHPDLHFVYPTVIQEKPKKNKSADYIGQWRSFISRNPFGGIHDWYAELDVQNKQGLIRVDDAEDMVKQLSLKSFEGGYKAMIVWLAEKMNVETANKILKILEEPTPRTIIILIAEDEHEILPTVRSRCQIVRFNRLSDNDVTAGLVSREKADPYHARTVARKAAGNFAKALRLLQDEDDESQYEQWFVQWVRGAFKAKGNPSAISDLLGWSEEISRLGREEQKKFLLFCSELFRQALLLNYQAPSLVYMEPKVDKFKLENFAPFVNGSNIADISREIDDAIYHIERNGNGKMILTDLSIKLTRLIHKK